MKTKLALSLLILTLIACGDSSSPNNNSQDQGLPVNKDQVLTGSLYGDAFTFVSGSYDKEEDTLHINLYPEAPLPEAERLWTPWNSNLNMIMFSIPAKVASYIIPYKLNPNSPTITSPTLYFAAEALNIMSDFGTVEIYRIDVTAGIVEGGLHISMPDKGTELNGTFTVQDISSF